MVDQFSVSQRARGDIHGAPGETFGALSFTYSNTPFEVLSDATGEVPLTFALSFDADGFFEDSGSGSQQFSFYLVHLSQAGVPTVMNEVMGVYVFDGSGISFEDFLVDGGQGPTFVHQTQGNSMAEPANVSLSYHMTVEVQPGETYAGLLTSDIGLSTFSLDANDPGGTAYMASDNSLTLTISSPLTGVQFRGLTGVPEPATGLITALAAVVLGIQRTRSVVRLEESEVMLGVDYH